MRKYRLSARERANQVVLDECRFYLGELRAVGATHRRVEAVGWVWLRRGRYLRAWEQGP